MKRMIVRFTMLITAIAVMFGGLTFVASPVANADESVEIVITGEDSAVVSEKVTLKDTARARADGKVQLSYFNPNAKGWSLAKAKQCKLIFVSIKWSKAKIKRVVKANQRKVNGTWCVRLKHGSTWANSGKEGKRKVPFTATVRGQWSLMTLKYPATGVWVHQGEFRGGKFFQVCENWWMIGLRPVLTDNNVAMVRSEAEVEYANDWELGAEVKGTLYATYKCGGATIQIEASVRAWAYDYGRFYLRASSLAAAQAKGGERVRAMSLASVTATATHDAMVGAEYELRLKATCSEQPTENPPVFVQFREMNDLEVNWVDDHCVTVDLPAGHTATVYWDADFGSFAIPQKAAQDGVQVCSDYKAPSEVPASGTDKIHVRAVDNTTDLSVQKSTQPFVIHPTAGHPG